MPTYRWGLPQRGYGHGWVESGHKFGAVEATNPAPGRFPLPVFCGKLAGRAKSHIMTLDELGTRICIMGPSNSGKSTMAEAISRARRLVPIHLDQLHHLPHTDWVPRPAEEFGALHDAAIMGPRWVIDGNYSQLLPKRLQHATGFILLDVPTVVSLYRYIRRCWFERDRRGALEGGRDSVKWDVIHHIAVATRANRNRYEQMFGDIHLPKIRLDSTRALAEFYCVNGLSR